MAEAPYLSIHSLSFKVSQKQLFSDLSFVVHPGERWGIVGPNGAGKSTLFKLLNKQLDPDDGIIAVRKGIRVAMVNQEFKFDPTETISQYLGRSISEYLESDDLHIELTVENLLQSILKIGKFQGMEEKKISECSGGQQKRLQIIAALLKQPHLLLLDEPTNHLDVATVEWLEDFLLNVAESGMGAIGIRNKNRVVEPCAFVIISHDRALLDTLVTRVLEIDAGRARVFEGNFEKYMEQRVALQIAEHKEVERMSNLFRRELSWLRSGTKARTTKQQARIDRAHQLERNLRDGKQQTQAARSVDLAFESQLVSFKRNEEDNYVPVVRSMGSQKLVELKKFTLPHPSAQRPQHSILKDFNLSVHAGMRLALLGPNGCGKTSIMRALMQELKPTLGEIKLHDLLKISYFDQARAQLPLDQSVLKTVCPEGDSVTLNGRKLHVMSYLDRFLFTKYDAQKPIGDLSGGERARVLLARMMLENSNLLILDEPTNDLDIQTLQMLEMNLCDFQGGLVFTSHDRYFIQKVATDILAYSGEKIVDDKVIAQWQHFRDLDQALEHIAKIENSSSDKEEKKEKKVELERVSKSSKKLGYMEQREYDQLEIRIPLLEKDLAEKTKNLEQAYREGKDFKVTGGLSEEVQNLQTQLTQSVARWEALFERLMD